MTSLPSTVNSLADVLTWRAQQSPDTLVFRYLPNGECEQPEQHQCLTFAELQQQAHTLAQCLLQHTQAGERVLLLFPDGLAFIKAFYACAYAGLVAVPGYPPKKNQKMQRLHGIIDDCKPALVLTESKSKNLVDTLFSSINSDVPCLACDQLIADTAADANTDESIKLPQVSRDQVAFLQYTSGSTGVPKGVMVSHGNILANLHAIELAFTTEPGDRQVSWLPLFHDMGLIAGVMLAVYGAVETTLMSPTAFLQKPIRWLKAIECFNAKGSGGPNFAYELCCTAIKAEDRQALDLSQWQLAFSGAEPVRAQTLQRFTETFADSGFKPEVFFPCYGMAEVTLFLTAGQVPVMPRIDHFDSEALASNYAKRLPASDDTSSQALVSCGATWSDEEVVIVDPQTLSRCDDGQVGEIWARGPSIAQGYWQRDEINQQTFQQFYLLDDGNPSHYGDYLCTGDLGFIDEGELFVTGRLKDLLIIRGRNYYPQDIEETVASCHEALMPSATAAVCVDKNGVSQLVVVQELKRTWLRKYASDEVFSAIRQQVAESHELPLAHIYLLKPGRIAKTSSGKIQRHACLQQIVDGAIEAHDQWPAITTVNTETDTEAIDNDADTGSDIVSDSGKSNSDAPRPQFSAEQIEQWLRQQIAQLTGDPIEQIDRQAPFTRFGLGSLEMVRLSGELESWLQREISPTLAYDYPTVGALASYLAKSTDTGWQGDQKHSENASPGAVRLSVSDSADACDKQNDNIAIIGLSCRFPGADNAEQYWALIHDGIDAVDVIPPERWNVDDYYASDLSAGKMNTRWGGFLADIERFDAGFFGIAAAEARQMDPQQRLLLEQSYLALQDGGYSLARIEGSDSGVFCCAAASDYGNLVNQAGQSSSAYFATGNSLSISANRLSYLFDLHGPSIAVDSACSSSLSVVHLACASLRRRECSLALAGAVNLLLAANVTVALAQAGVMASDGRCKTFDSRADGYVRSEGCGVLLLKRQADAEAEGDPIRALINGSALVQDGRSNGLSAPNGIAQQQVIRQALQQAGLQAAHIDYVETHGTGTQLGDPIEVNALAQVFREGEEPGGQAPGDGRTPLTIGSVKANIGHLEAAAGMAGLIKTVLMLQHQCLPGQIHLQQLNPVIDWATLPLQVLQQNQDWPHRDDGPRRAGVSSFGFGGTNAHVIVQQAPQSDALVTQHSQPASELPGSCLLALSARSPAALQQLANRYGQLLQKADESQWRHYCQLHNQQRDHFEFRSALCADNRLSLMEQCKSLPSNKIQQVSNGNTPLVFVFPGQGPQYAGMGQALYGQQPVFTDVIDRCEQWLLPRLQLPLTELLWGQYSDRLDQTRYTQPAMFAIEVALASTWQAWGIEPSYVIGHSFGECAAAVVAGLLSLEDGLALVEARGRLMAELAENGRMMVVFAEPQRVQPLLQNYRDSVAIAAINAHDNLVLSGLASHIEALQQQLQQQQIETQVLAVSIASHSPLMQPMLQEFAVVAQSLAPRANRYPIISTVSGDLEPADSYQAHYWVDQVASTVQFQAAVQTALNECQSAGEKPIFLEIGPSASLLGVISRDIDEQQATLLASMNKAKTADQQMVSSLGHLYQQGFTVNWHAVASAPDDAAEPLAALPRYAFQRQRFWLLDKLSSDAIDAGKSATKAVQQDNQGQLHPLLQRNISPLTGLRFSSEFSGDEFFLADHKLAQHEWEQFSVLPGVAYLEMAQQALQQLHNSDPACHGWQLCDVRWQRPYFVAADVTPELYVQLQAGAEEQLDIQVYSGPHDPVDSQHLTYASALAKPAAADIAAARRLDIDLWQSQLRPCALSTEAIYQTFAQVGIHYGPAHRGLQRVWVADDQALAQLQLPITQQADATSYLLHPGLMDAILQVVGAWMMDRQQSTEPSGDQSPNGPPVGPFQLALPFALQQLQWQGAGDISELATRARKLSAGPVWVKLSCQAATSSQNPLQQLYNLDVYDQQGELQLILHGFQVAPIASLQAILPAPPLDKQAVADSALYQLHWQPDDSKPAADTKDNEVTSLSTASTSTTEKTATHSTQQPGSWLIFADDQGVAEQLAQRWRDVGDEVVMVHCGNQGLQQRDDHHWQMDPQHAAILPVLMQRILASLSSSLKGVLFLWPLNAGANSQGTFIGPDLQRLQGLTAGSALVIGKAMIQRELPQHCRFWCVTQQAQRLPKDMAIDGEANKHNMAQIDPGQSLMAGFANAMTFEQPALFGALMDLPKQVDSADINLLWGDIQQRQIPQSDEEERLVYRQGQRWVNRLQRIPAAANKPSKSQPPIDSRASYLITGGFGAIGLTIARWLVSQGARQLILLGRRLPDSKSANSDHTIQSTLQALQQQGANIHAYAADIADSQQVAELFGWMNNERAPLKGIFHSAGSTGDYLPIERNTQAQFDQVYAAKVTGTWLLHQHTEALALDYFVCCSSLAAVMGSHGQSHYAAANAFQDAIAHYRQQRSLAATSINWGPWRDGGLAAASQTQQTMLKVGISPFSQNDGESWITPALTCNQPQVIAADIDWQKYGTIYQALKSRPLIDVLINEQNTLAAAQPGADNSNNSDNPSDFLQAYHQLNNTEQQHALQSLLIAQLAELLELPEADVSVQRPLFEMGLDSLMATRVAAEIKKLLGLELTMQVLQEHPSIAELSQWLQNSIPAADADVKPLQTSPPDTAPYNITLQHMADGTKRLSWQHPYEEFFVYPDFLWGAQVEEKLVLDGEEVMNRYETCSDMFIELGGDGELVKQQLGYRVRMFVVEKTAFEGEIRDYTPWGE